MFFAVMKFEFTQRMRKVSTLFFFLLLTANGYIALLRESGPMRLLRIKPGESVAINAPYVLFFLINISMTLGILIAIAFFGKAAHRDFKHNTHELMFSFPINKRDYIGGRFCGALLSTLLVFSGTAIGAALAALFPAWNADRLAHVPLAAYLQPYLTAVLPNILLAGALSFFLILSARKFFPVYAGLTGLLSLYIAASALGNAHHFFAASLLDPFGLIGSQNIYMYWDVAQKNSLLVPLAGAFLINRLIWLGVSLVLLAAAFFRLKTTAYIEKRKKFRARSRKKADAAEADLDFVRSADRPALRFGFPARLRQTLFVAWDDFTGLMRNTYFLIILGLGSLLVFFLGFRNVGLIKGTPSLPVTSQVLDALRIPFYLFSLLVIIFASGDLIWKDRNKGFSSIRDSLPIPDWISFFGKWGALILVQAVIAMITLLSGMAVQAMQGYTRFEIPLYLTELFAIRWVYFSLLSAFALFIQAVLNHRFPAYILSLLLIDDLMPSLGLTHHLWRFGSTPWYTYTEMNGYGPFVKPLLAFNAYWCAFLVILIVVVLLFWVRGYDRGLRHRFREAGKRFTRAKGVSLAAGLALCFLIGGYIIHNTNHLNRFEKTKDRDRMCAEYEKLYKHLDDIPQPMVVSLNTQMDLYPGQRRLHCRGVLVLANRTEEAITDLVVHVPRDAEIHLLEWTKSYTTKHRDPRFGLHLITLAEPMAAGETTEMRFDLEYAERGFPNHSRPSTWSLPHTSLVRNGSFFYNFDVMPSLGYDPFFQYELKGRSQRNRYNLPRQKAMSDPNDPQALRFLPMGKDSQWIEFEAVLSTSQDQIMITSGELIRTWSEKGRRYFHYKEKGPILKHLAFLSARYQVRRDTWGDVDIEIYHHKTHDTNITLMMEAAKHSLELFTREFGPYQFKYLRIVEFPRYKIEAAGFPGVIPISEGYGFIARFSPDRVEYAYRVMAHEVGHMWWGHQVLGAWTEGIFLLSETMAQYAALLVIDEKYEKPLIDDYVRREMDRYLRGRSVESMGEVPLTRANQESVHVHYAKGFCVMNALREYIGEKNLNGILRTFIRDKKFKSAPYTNSFEFMEYLRTAVPDELDYILEDWFESITFYDAGIEEASFRKGKSGTYQVTIAYDIKKTRADGIGNETEVEINDLFPVGIYDADGRELYYGKHRIRSGRGTLEIRTEEEPAAAVLDPHLFLIDKNIKDNRHPIQRSDGESRHP